MYFSDKNNKTISYIFLTCQVTESVWDEYNMWVGINTMQHYLPKHSFNHFSLIKK